MKILQESIEDNKHNFTRFLVVSNPNKADFLRPLEQTNKASIVFSLPHEEGSLSQVLSIFSFYKSQPDKNYSRCLHWPRMGIYVLC